VLLRSTGSCPVRLDSGLGAAGPLRAALARGRRRRGTSRAGLVLRVDNETALGARRPTPADCCRRPHLAKTSQSGHRPVSEFPDDDAEVVLDLVMQIPSGRVSTYEYLRD